MKPAQYPDLKVLIDKLDRRNRERQSARAIMAGSVVLGLLVLASPFLGSNPKPVASAPDPTVPAAIPDSYQDTLVTAKAAIVYDLTTGEVLYEKNAKSQLPLASLTKLLTAYAAVSSLRPDARITLSAEALAQEGDSGFIEGEQFAYQDLAKLALVASSNDAAAALAEAAADIDAISGKQMLASAAAAIGLPQTYAVNGTGLDVSESVSGGYGSAYDVAQLAGALLTKAPELAETTTHSSITVRSVDGTVHTLQNTNHDATTIPNLLLSKTGFTDLAGGNLAVVYDAGIGHPIAVVVLGSTREGRFADVRELMNRTGDYFAGISVNTAP